MPPCLADLTRHSCNDHGACCPGCWESAMAGVIDRRYRTDEAEHLVEHCIDLAEQGAVAGDTLPGWAQLRQPILEALPTHNGDKPKSVSWLPGVLEKMGRAADAV